MFSKISVLVPTRKRIPRLRILLKSYEETTSGSPESSELIFRADEDDLETQDFLSDQLLVVGPRHEGYRSMPMFFNEMWAFASGDVFMCGSDDMVFKTKNWAPLILEEANRYPDGLFDFGVETYNKKHYPFSIVSRKATEKLGFLWDPRIYWGDVYLRDVMAAFGRCFPLPSIHIDHDWVGHKPDQTFLEANQNDIFRRDPNYWKGTHARAVRDAVEKLHGSL